ncbi:MAG TPA: hypothetical protein VIS94_17380 [Desulfomonilia bacterium]
MKKRGEYWWGHKLEDPELGKVARTPTPCSCWTCGNPRRHFKEASIQERRLAMSVRKSVNALRNSETA